MNDDDADESEPGQDRADNWGLDEVDWKQGHKSIQEEPFTEVIESFCFVIFGLDESEDLEHVVCHEDIEQRHGDHDFFRVDFADLAAIVDQFNQFAHFVSGCIFFYLANELLFI